MDQGSFRVKLVLNGRAPPGIGIRVTRSKEAFTAAAERAFDVHSTRLRLFLEDGTEIRDFTAIERDDLLFCSFDGSDFQPAGFQGNQPVGSRDKRPREPERPLNKRALKELNDIWRSMNTEEGKDIVARLLDPEDSLAWQATILGPKGSPYKNGTFYVDILLPPEYPFKPPNVTFATPILHPAVDPQGRMTGGMLQDWSPALTVFKVLKMLQAMMADPRLEVRGAPEKCDGQVVSEIRTRYEDFERRAAAHTGAHAIAK